jgi:peptidoglycan/LPS O-acetylase OafA/YrhL
MSKTVLNAAGTSAGGMVSTAPTKTINMKWFDYLYIFVGLALIVFTYLNLEYPYSYKYDFTPTSSFDTTAFATVAVIGVLIAIFGFLDYRNVKSMSNKVYYAVIVFILGIPLIPLYTYYNGYWTGVFGDNYNLTGVSLTGLLLIFAALGEIYLLRKQSSMHM